MNSALWAMYLLYDIILIVFTILGFPYLAAKFFLDKRHRDGMKDRLGFPRKTDSAAASGRKRLWLHAVSLGEVHAALPFIREVKLRHPALSIILSTVTEAGHLAAMEKARQVDQVVFSPFDYSWVAKRAIERLAPDFFATMEKEIWPNLLRELAKRKIPAIMLNGRLSGRSYRRYRPVKFFIGRALADMELLCMQTEEDAQRIIRLGARADRVVVTGSLKYDSSLMPGGSDVERELRAELGLDEESKVMVCGSSHEGEEEALLLAYSDLLRRHAGLRLILAPRHLSRLKEVEKVVGRFGFYALMRSEISSSRKLSPGAVLIVDKFGQLAPLYSLGTINFIGGSLVHVGGHNPLEVAAWRKVALFGKYMFNFEEVARKLAESGGGIMVEGWEDLARWADRLLCSPEDLRARGESAYKVLLENAGAARRSAELFQQVARLN